MADKPEKTVIGIFEDRKKARNAIEALVDADFKNDHLGFMAQHPGLHVKGESEPESSAKTLARGVLGGILGAADALLIPFIGPSDASSVFATVLPVTEEAIDKLPYPGSHRRHTKAESSDTPTAAQPEAVPQAHPLAHEDSVVNEETAREGARTGLVTGGVIGGMLGAAASLLVPGLGPVIAGGILAATLGGITLGGTAGSFLGTFKGLGVPEDKARLYEQEFKAGNTIVVVRTADEDQKASKILSNEGAHHVDAH